MLNQSNVMSFVATANAVAALKFYQDVLGLALVEDGPFALVFDANGITLRVQKVQAVVNTGYTTLGWDVADIKTEVQQLAQRGVTFEQFEGLDQDEAGIWTTPDGSMVAWFRDPDGSILSLTQHVRS
jgi:catechol 2,3-dioxygenase-like lactoylglutathione lyase family enzyme